MSCTSASMFSSFWTFNGPITKDSEYAELRHNGPQRLTVWWLTGKIAPLLIMSSVLVRNPVVM